MSFISVTGQNWVFKTYDDRKVQKISEVFSLDEIVSRLLVIRNIDQDNINAFLNPSIKSSMPNPYQIIDMDGAVNRIYKSLEKSETIGIFGDYDVDGATSTALLANYFIMIKQKVNTYIPDRKTEGYGPNINGFSKLIENGSKIIFTVDCGTSSFEAIKFSQGKGIDTIVLDHHQADLKLPNAHSIVNPNRIDDKSKLDYLCAAGVCLMFLSALNKKLRESNWFKKNKIEEPNIINFLDLVSLGTVCDVVPLVGLNRAIVYQGLKLIKKRNNLGLKTLYDICNISSKPTTYHLGYVLGPRINAGGRVGKSSHGSELLISHDPQKVYKIANDLNLYNEERKKIEDILLSKVEIEAEKNLSDPVLVLYGDDWHEGIIGIVASRIKDKYNKPTILITFNGAHGKGSARSVYGFDIGLMIITAVQNQILEKGGGHKMAGGFSINKNKLDNFKKLLIKKFNKLKINLNETKKIYIDTVVAPSALNEDFYNNINMLSPFGPGNSEPKFIIEEVKVVNSTLIGSKHIKVVLYGKDGKTFKAIAFNSQKTVYEKYLSKFYKKPLNIAGKMSMNDWRGNKNIEFIIEDVSVH